MRSGWPRDSASFSVVVPHGSGVRRVLELCDIASVGDLVASRDEALAEGESTPA